MSDTFSTSNYEITEAKLVNYSGSKELDIIGIITDISFEQSIDKPAWTGLISVIDNLGVLESFPLRGEERLDLSITSYDTNTTVNLKTQVVRIGNVGTNQTNDGVVYTISIISRLSYEANKTIVTKSFRDQKASTIAKKLFNEYYGKTTPNGLLTNSNNVERFSLTDKKDKGISFYAHPTKGLLRAVIPGYSPWKSLSFLTKKAYSPNSSSSSFRFFETYDSFYWVTDEFLIKRAINGKEVINLTYEPDTSRDPKNVADQLRRIETLSNPNRVDTNSDMVNGGYKNKIIEIDLLRRKVTENVHDFFDESIMDMDGKYKKVSADDVIHTKEFAEDTFTDNNAMTHLLFTDYQTNPNLEGEEAQLRGNQHYAEIISDRISYRHHLMSTSIAATIKGRFDIQAGSLVKIELANLSSENRKQNEQLYGNYIVHSASHSFNQGTLNTSLKLIKYDWS